MIQALALAALTLSGRATISQILALSLLSGFITAVDVPARQSFMIEMVGRREDRRSVARCAADVSHQTDAVIRALLALYGRRG